MNFLVICFVVLIAYSASNPAPFIPTHSRGCIYIEGRCSSECEEGTHAYTTGCDYLMPEATCDNPKPELDRRGMICDYTACYCDEPSVRDKKSGKCVTLEDCPKE